MKLKNLSHNWSIENFQELYSMAQTPSVIYSNQFLTQNEELNFAIRLVPKFQKQICPDPKQFINYISLYLMCEKCKYEQMTANFSLSMSLNEDKLRELKFQNERFCESQQQQGSNKFIEVDSILKILKKCNKFDIKISCNVSV